MDQTRLLPQELIEMLIDQFKGDKLVLPVCALVSQAWLPRARHHLFYRLSVHDGPNGCNLVSLHGFLQSNPHLCPFIVKLRVENEPRDPDLKDLSDDEPDPPNEQTKHRIQVDEHILRSIFQLCPYIDTLILHNIALLPLLSHIPSSLVSPSFPLHKLVISNVAGPMERLCYISALFTNIRILEVLETGQSLRLVHEEDVAQREFPCFLPSHLRLHSLTVEGGHSWSATEFTQGIPHAIIYESLQELDITFDTLDFTSQVEAFHSLLQTPVGARLRVLRVNYAMVDLVYVMHPSQSGFGAGGNFNLTWCTSLECLDVCIYNAWHSSEEGEPPETQDSVQQFDCLVDLLRQGLPRSLKRLAIRFALLEIRNHKAAEAMSTLLPWHRLDSVLCDLARRGLEGVKVEIQGRRADAWCSSECVENLPVSWQGVVTSGLPSFLKTGLAQF